jgi:hypothetical protein
MPEKKIIGISTSVETVLEAQRRVTNCNLDIQNALKRWNCTIGPRILLSARMPEFGWEIIPLEEIPAQGGS